MPAYTAVAARQSLQRPEPAPPVKKSTKIKWSPAVREYVQRAFEPGNAIPGISREEVEDRLKLVITSAAETNRLEGVDWTKHPLPQQLIKIERDQAKIIGAQESLLNGVNTGAPVLSFRASPDNAARKRKSPDEDVMDTERPGTPPWRKKNGSNGTAHGLEERMALPDKKISKKQKKAEAFRANAAASKLPADLEKRKQRFGNITPDTGFASRDDSPEPDRNAGPIQGTRQKLEKNYFRLTSAPNPADVRPLPILKQALELVKQKWKETGNYPYACDQLKSIRQDLTVQHIKNEFTVTVYEVHAHIALEKRDLGEYNQCQTQLRGLYQQKIGGKREEFTAYRILYFIYTCSRTDMNDVLADLTTADKQTPAVKHALEVRSALASGNYHKFFRLYNDTPFMGAYLMDMFIERERVAALAAMCRT